VRSTCDALCVALDGTEREWLLATATAVADVAGWVKVGLEAFTAHGPGLVTELAGRAGKVFLDLKLHDIPATVRRAAANSAACGARMMTVHAAGGPAMLEAAVAGVREAGVEPPPLVVAVTLLTSLDAATLDELGLAASPADLVTGWARLARRCGVDGVVCSAHEAAAVRSAVGEPFLIVTPGIRPAWAGRDDQRRVSTPREARAAGADILVVGRPITGARSPREAAREVLEEIEAGRGA